MLPFPSVEMLETMRCLLGLPGADQQRFLRSMQVMKHLKDIPIERYPDVLQALTQFNSFPAHERAAVLDTFAELLTFQEANPDDTQGGR